MYICGMYVAYITQGYNVELMDTCDDYVCLFIMSFY